MCSDRYLSPSEAARRLGISAKALRLYEQRGLLAPARTAAGWRAYGPRQMARAAQIAALRALGLGLGQIARVLGGDAKELEAALGMHQASLEARMRDLAAAAKHVGALRSGLAQGYLPDAAEPSGLMPPGEPAIAFALPWPWGGERFELRDIRALNFIVGPLGSGKTRLARCLAQTLPGAAFLGLERAADGAAAHARLDADASLSGRVDRSIGRLVEDGGTVSDALVALVAALESEGPAVLVVDMVEQGLNRSTQQALIAQLRRRPPGSRPLFLLTRSCAILDLAAVGADEAIFLCPANHSPPIRVAPYPGRPGYEAVATCLASPDVRARTEGVVAMRLQPGMPG